MPTYSPEAVAATIAAHLEAAVWSGGLATLAIPGGRSPGPVLTALAAIVQPFVRKRLHLFWVDERAVPPGAGDRNDAPTLSAWKAGGSLPAHIHALLPQVDDLADLETAAEVYAQTIEEVAEDGKLDVCLLGIGEDGHVASLFPNHAGLHERRKVFAVYDSPKPPAQRLTMSLPLLSQASLRIVLAAGEAKGAVCQQAVTESSPSIPVSLLPRRATLWYYDASAVSGLHE